MVSEKHRFDRIEGLTHGARRDVARVAQARVDQFREFAILWRMRGMKIIELDTEIVEIPSMLLANRLNQHLWRNPLLLGFEHDRRAVCVIRADETRPLTVQALKTHPDVSLDVFHHVADVNRSIGVRQRTGDKDISAGAIHRSCSFERSSSG